LIGFAEEKSFERVFFFFGFGDFGFCCRVLPLSLDFSGIKTCFGEII
jgi:hypothetical protein